MDRPRLRILFTLALLAGASCGGASSSPYLPLAPERSATTPSRGQSAIESLGRDSLGYEVAFAGPHLVSVELTTRFALVIRSRQQRDAQSRRIDLGEADFDILDLATTTDGSRAFVASAAGWVRGYQLETGALLSEWRMGSGVTALALSDDREYLAIGTKTGVICLRRLRDAAQLQCVHAHPSDVAALDIRDQTLASGDFHGTITTWSLPALRELARIEGKGYISELAFSKDGKTLAAARNLRKPVRTPELETRERESARVDPPGHNTIELHSMASPASPRTLVGHRSVISSLAWAGSDLISTSWDRSVRIWNTQEPGIVRTLLKLTHLGSGVAASPAGGHVAAVGWATRDGNASLTTLQLLYGRE